MKLRLFKPEFMAVGAAVFILSYILMLRPVIGVADNGDFQRIMRPAGLAYMTGNRDDIYFGYVNRQYRIVIGIPLSGGYFSTEIPVVEAAVFISQMVRNSWVFDIRYLSLVYSLVFLAALFLIVRYGRKKLGAAAWLLAALMVFIFADIGYISYFNSFYGEAVSLAFLLLAAGAFVCIAAAEKPQFWALAVFFTAALIFAGAKVQNCPAGILAALLGLRLLKLRGDRLWKVFTVVSAAAVVMVSLMSYVSVSRDIKVCNKYQSVFYGILKGSPDPAKDLEELGLSPNLAVLAGTNYFMESYPIDIRSTDFKNELYESVNHFDIAYFYLKHPDRLMNKLAIAAQNAFKLKQGFGNYEKYPGIKYKQTSNIFGFWSDFKMYVLPHSLLFIVIVYLLFFMVLIMEYIRCRNVNERLLIELLLMIGLIGAIQLAVSVIGDGEADLSKHLFLFNVGFDMILLSGTVYIARLLTDSLRRLAIKLIPAGTRHG